MNMSTLLPKAYRTPLLIGVVTCAGRIGFEYAKSMWTKESIVIIPADPVGDFLEPLDATFPLLTEVEYIEESVESISHDKEPETRVNVFRVDDSWDEEYELEHRNPDVPYVITVDEYIGAEFDFKQSTVTYYASDDIMANESDVPIYNWNSLMGDLRWGHGSNDKNVVYIRNESLGQEWEVLLHQGSYEVEVQGLHEEDGELRHSQHRVLKFRDD
jgi:hypothetical protein